MVEGPNEEMHARERVVEGMRYRRRKVKERQVAAEDLGSLS